MSEQPPATGLRRAASDEPLTLRGLIASIGGALGIVEAVLPSLVFIVAYQVVVLRIGSTQLDRQALLPVVLAPLALSAVFLIIRVARRQGVATAIGGAVGAAVSAAFALLTGDATDSFVPGLLTNAAYGLVFLVSLLVRRPLIGVVAGLLLQDRDWRSDATKRRLYTWLTVLWTGLFAVRLAVQVPLFLARDPIALSIAKIALGLPLYAPVLVLTILGVQALHRRGRAADPA